MQVPVITSGVAVTLPEADVLTLAPRRRTFPARFVGYSRALAARVLPPIVVVSFAIYLCYRFAARAARLLGDAGTLVLFRLSAFILLAVGVKILADGLAERFTAG